MPDDAAERRLLTIPISHFCEKARWALERAGLSYVEERHVQGIHQLVARRAGGARTVPVLIAGEAVFAESEAILRYADRGLAPADRLFPEEPSLEAEVRDLCRWLDAGLGPDARRVIYAHMLPRKRLILRFNNQGVPTWEARLMSGLWPLTSRWAVRELGLASTTVRDDGIRVRKAFDAVAERLADGRTHLCGDRFTAADVTFACLAAAVLLPPQYGVRLPQPQELPAPLAREITSFRDHPAGVYALQLFETQRARRVGPAG